MLRFLLHQVSGLPCVPDGVGVCFEFYFWAGIAVQYTPRRQICKKLTQSFYDLLAFIFA